MTNFDVFNGDADGIISLVQLRLAAPKQAELITGIKRDISLVKQIPIAAINEHSSVTILDISMEKNADALHAVLKTGASVMYSDHHRSGEIPNVVNLNAHIDLDANTCTSLIVDNLLAGQFHDWAIAAAFGDNLIKVATELCKKQGYSAEQVEQLKELGTLVNYNGYGATTDDLAFHPADLFKQLVQYSSPFDCIKDPSSAFHTLKSAFDSDFNQALSADVLHESELAKAVLLEDAAWSRRISGTYGNHLANESPDTAHIVVTVVDDAHYLISLRAPLNNKTGAGDICATFETGGGRAAAAGINLLPKQDLPKLITAVERYYA
ncbi:DHHA1 domain-containing protein [Psychrosphaera algicola]|uniref:DHH family phosphoesterase n=1 Tax=Psychrosphaera algicola TaxID=3023714 RepID=A0ABT5FJH6_9GAMM|nr:DHH family phosphoesterase [Psychrosphaera sp. G1-22]MDC2891361.1 DHH family phosphoesterase [Psychrosphaera sp. G1-22]